MTDSDMTQMTSNRPYLLRAFYEWIVDNNLTPYIVVDAEAPMATLPMQFVQDGRITLDVSPDAVVRLELGKETVSFSARFAGQAMDVVFPTEAVLAIFAQENGQGTFLPEPDYSTYQAQKEEVTKPVSHLRVVK